MIPILVGILLGFLIAFYITMKIRKNMKGGIFFAFAYMRIFFGFFGGFVGLFTTILLSIFLPDQSYQISERVQLYGVSSSVVSGGELFLGIGTINGELVYKVYYPDPDQANAYHPDILSFMTLCIRLLS